MLDFFPNADHAGIYAAQAGGHFERRGAEGEHPPAARPGRADQAGGRRPRRPGHLLRARGAAGARPGAERDLRRRAGAQAAHLDHLAARGARSARRRTSRARRWATRGSTTRQAYLRTILLNAGVDPSIVKVRDVGFNLSPALLTKKVDAVLGAFWNYEGTDLRLKKRKPRIIKVDDAGVPTYDELVLVANESALERDGERIRAFIGALARGTQRPRAATPTRRIEGLLTANPDLDPKLQRAVGEGHAAAVPAAGGQAVRLPGPAGAAGVRRLDAGEPAGHEDPRRHAARSPTTSCPARGSDGARYKPRHDPAHAARAARDPRRSPSSAGCGGDDGERRGVRGRRRRCWRRRSPSRSTAPS